MDDGWVMGGWMDDGLRDNGWVMGGWMMNGEMMDV